MAERTISDEIETQIHHSIKQINHPIKARVHKIYNDKHVDIKINDRILKYIPYIGSNPSIDGLCVLLFLDNNVNDYIVLL